LSSINSLFVVAVVVVFFCISTLAESVVVVVVVVIVVVVRDIQPWPCNIDVFGIGSTDAIRSDVAAFDDHR